MEEQSRSLKEIYHHALSKLAQKVNEGQMSPETAETISSVWKKIVLEYSVVSNVPKPVPVYTEHNTVPLGSPFAKNLKQAVESGQIDETAFSELMEDDDTADALFELEHYLHSKNYNNEGLSHHDTIDEPK